jgi:hypothetical protein
MPVRFEMQAMCHGKNGDFQLGAIAPDELLCALHIKPAGHVCGRFLSRFAQKVVNHVYTGIARSLAKAGEVIGSPGRGGLGPVLAIVSSTSFGKTESGIKADGWSPYLAEDKGKVADWTFPWFAGLVPCPSTKPTKTRAKTAGRSHPDRCVRPTNLVMERGAVVLSGDAGHKMESDVRRSLAV